MDTLWASWRLNYVSGKKNDNCIFCDFPKEGNDAANHILYQGKYSYVIMNAFPYSNGHLMVIPFRHISDFCLLTSDEVCEIMELAKKSVEALKLTYNPHGFNIGWNIGEAGGAGIAAHLHMHIVPRWSGDTNFMPVIGDVKVIPEDMESSYKKIKINLDKVLLKESDV